MIMKNVSYMLKFAFFSILMYENKYLTIYPEINEYDKDDGFQLTVSLTHVGWLIIKEYFKFDNEYMKKTQFNGK